MDPQYIDQPWSWGKLLSVLEHLWVPVLVIGTSGTAGMIRRLRANLLDELQKQYYVTALAKGMPRNRALFKYPLRMALNPFIADIGSICCRSSFPARQSLPWFSICRPRDRCSCRRCRARTCTLPARSSCGWPCSRSSACCSRILPWPSSIRGSGWAAGWRNERGRRPRWRGGRTRPTGPFRRRCGRALRQQRRLGSLPSGTADPTAGSLLPGPAMEAHVVEAAAPPTRRDQRLRPAGDVSVDCRVRDDRALPSRNPEHRPYLRTAPGGSLLPRRAVYRAVRVRV